MALDSPQLTAFCNEDLRVISDRLVAIDVRLAPIIAEYNAKNLGTVINDGGSSGPVLDGSAVDGRTIVTGGDVFNLVTLLIDLQTFLTQGRKDVLYKWQVNGAG